MRYGKGSTMKKSDRNLLQAKLSQLSAPTPTREPKPNATDEIDALYGSSDNSVLPAPVRGTAPVSDTAPSQYTGALSQPAPVLETAPVHEAAQPLHGTAP